MCKYLETYDLLIGLLKISSPAMYELILPSITKNMALFNFRHNQCHRSNLNGFNFGPGVTPYSIGIIWYSVTGYYVSLETVEMAIKGKLN